MKLFAFNESQCQRWGQKFDKPTFFYSRQSIVNQFDSLRKCLPDRFDIAYAVKANGHPQIIETLANLGSLFDCASMGELKKVHQYGRGNECFMTGPAKSKEEIGWALSNKVRIQAENYTDLEIIDAIAKEDNLGLPIEVSLRIHPQKAASGAKSIIGGDGPSVFGVDEEMLTAFLTKVGTLSTIKITGVHCFTGSNMSDFRDILNHFDNVCRIAKGLFDRGYEMDFIDMGGGLGIPYSESDNLLNLNMLGKGLERIVRLNSWFQGTFLIEPGRFLVGPCGVYITKVLRTKESRGTNFAVCQGGINHLIRPLLTGQPFPVMALGVDGAPQKTVLAGPLCTSLDRLGTVYLPSLIPGDVLAFGQCGAYGWSEAMNYFLDHPHAGEVWIDNQPQVH